MKNINAGKSQIESLNEASERNPSLYFRRALWQIVNAIKAGSDIGKTLEVITENLSEEQLNQIKSYGQELNPWTMLYMIVAVIAPSLGVTFILFRHNDTGDTLPGNTAGPFLVSGVFHRLHKIQEAINGGVNETYIQGRGKICSVQEQA